VVCGSFYQKLIPSSKLRPGIYLEYDVPPAESFIRVEKNVPFETICWMNFDVTACSLVTC